ncbi:MAG: peptide deformylase [Acidimicrobiales bacterium]
MSLDEIAPYEIRLIGDPVLRQVANEIENIDSSLVALSNDMVLTMRAAAGLGLAAPQVGVQKRFFVYDMGEGPRTIVNPVVQESEGEWLFDEGCLSFPDMSFEIVRASIVHVTGHDLDGNEVSVEADEVLGRLFLHELDHLNGILLLDHLDDEQLKVAKKELRLRAMQMPSRPSVGGLQLP